MHKLVNGIPVEMTEQEIVDLEASRVPVPPTVADYTVAVQAHLDAGARTRNYDNIVSACSYAGAPNPFQEEGAAFLAWRGECWALCHQIMAGVESGQRAQPTIAELVALMPLFPK